MQANKVAAQSAISIHTPTQGVTRDCTGIIFTTCDFNPHSHAGSDDEREGILKRYGISIHTPTQGVTAKSHNLHTRELCFSPKILYHSLRYYNSFRTNPHFFCILYYNLHVYLVRISQEIYVHLAFAPYNSYNILTILLAS